LGVLCLAAGYGLMTIKAGRSEPARLRCNVVLITISSLRADHLGCMGYRRDTTPHFDAFAQTAVLFRNAFATSGWMMPATGSIFTSLYPARHGATHINASLLEDPVTLAEILTRQGYYCVGFCCNPRLTTEKGFAQGFELYDDYSVSVMLESTAFDGESFNINATRTNDLINAAAIRWLGNNVREPFFLFVHYYDNHWDYLPPPPYDSLFDPNYDGPIDGTKIAREPLYSNPPPKRDIEHIVALYDGQVRQTDEDLGILLKHLHNTGLLQRSVVIIMGDHGEQFYEHGHTSHHGVYEELIHIPLAISLPHVEPKHKVVDALVSQVDIMPTVLDYLAIESPQSTRGVSLLPLIEGRARSVRDFIFAEYTGGAVRDVFALRSRRYKYCHTAQGDFGYDLFKDPQEKNKISPERFGPQLRQLGRILQELLTARMPGKAPVPGRHSQDRPAKENLPASPEPR